MGKRLACIALWLVIFQPGGWAQETGGGDGGGQSGGSSGGQGGSNNRERQRQQYRRPMFLTGRVMLDDGSAPPNPVVVDLVCQGTVVRQTHATSDGSFSFQLNFSRGGLNEPMPLDASVSSTGAGDLESTLTGGPMASGGRSRFRTGQRDSVNLSACELRPELAGYQSERLPLGVRRTLDSPDVGVILLYPTIQGEGGTVSANTLTAPKKARKAFQKAQRELSKEAPKRDLQKAARELEKAVKEYPEFSEAWQLLGEVRLGQHDATRARQAFEKAVESEPNFALPLVSLAQLELDSGRASQALEFSQRAALLSPNHPTALYVTAMASSVVGDLEQAEDSARKVQSGRFASRFPATHYVLGWVFSQRGEFETALQEYRQYLEAEPDTTLADHLREQIAEWESLGLVPPPSPAPPGG